MKLTRKIGAFALAAVLAAGLTAPALAAEDEVVTTSDDLLIATAEAPRALIVNGNELDASQLPQVDGVPLRLLAENDHGFADWYEDEGRGFASLVDHQVYITVATGEIELDGEALTDMTAQVVNGVTFLPVEFFDLLDGYQVAVDEETGFVSVTTPNSAPLVQLAYQIIDEMEMACGFRNSAEELSDYMGVNVDDFESFAAFSSMMIESDTLFIAKVKEGGDMDAAKEQFEARRAAVEQSFENYLPEPYEKALNGQVVENGDYVMLVISADNDQVIALFNAFVEAQA